MTPQAQQVADLLVKRDGVEPRAALVAARAAQSHIGLARALATDPHAASIRSKTLNVLAKLKGVGDAALGAHLLADTIAMRGDGVTRKEALDEDTQAIQAQRMAAFGLDENAKFQLLFAVKLKKVQKQHAVVKPGKNETYLIGKWSTCCLSTAMFWSGRWVGAWS